MEYSGKFPGFSEEQEVLGNPLYGVSFHVQVQGVIIQKYKEL
jgi:hypothetical protein